MIELRWLIMPETSGAKVLQYRYRFPKMHDAIDDYPPTKWGCSEWMNVETVSEAVTAPSASRRRDLR